MRLFPASVLLLLTLDAPGGASAFSPHRSLASATERFHRFAKKQSAGLARDLRVVFQGLNVEQNDVIADTHKVYCTRPDEAQAPLGNASATSPATRTSTSSGTTSTPTAVSPFKLVEEHVSSFTCTLRPEVTQRLISPDKTSSMDFPFGILLVRLTIP